MDDQERTPYDKAFEKLAFRVWLSGRSETNYSTARRNMMLAVREELTPVQHLYATAYYVNRRKVSEIAAEYGVDKSTVSQTLSRARTRLRRVLRYCSPELLRMTTEATVCASATPK